MIEIAPIVNRVLPRKSPNMLLALPLFHLWTDMFQSLHLLKYYPCRVDILLSNHLSYILNKQNQMRGTKKLLRLQQS
jgi:hypothetical protein